MSLHSGEAGLYSAVGGQVRTFDNDVVQQVWIDLVARLRPAGGGSPGAIPSRLIFREPRNGVFRYSSSMIHMQVRPPSDSEDEGHARGSQMQILVRFGNGFVVQLRPMQAQNLTLPSNAERFVIAVDPLQ